MDRVAAPSPADPVSRQVVTKEERGTPPLSRTDNDEAAQRKRPNHKQVKHCRWKNPASPANVKPAQADLSESTFLLQQTRANQKSTDGKEQAHAVRSSVRKTHQLRVVPQARIFHGVIEEHRDNRDRSPTIQSWQISRLGCIDHSSFNLE